MVMCAVSMGTGLSVGSCLGLGLGLCLLSLQLRLRVWLGRLTCWSLILAVAAQLVLSRLIAVVVILATTSSAGGGSSSW